MKTCPNCNAGLADDALFCTNCGTNLGAAPVQPPQPETQIQQQQPVYQQAPPQPQRSAEARQTGRRIFISRRNGHRKNRACQMHCR